MTQFALRISVVQALMFLVAGGALALDHRLDFDELDQGYRFRSGYQAYAGIGVTIGGEGDPTVVRPSVLACSPSQALRNNPSAASEFGSSDEDLTITLTGYTSDRVAVWVGKDQDTSPLSVVARLEGWGTDAGGHGYLVAEDEVELIPGLTGISHPLTVESSTGEITSIRVTYGHFSAPELVDCLDIHVWEGSPPEPPADTSPPEVHITHPADGDAVTTRTASGYVDDDRGIVGLTITTPLGSSPLPVPAPNFVDGRLRYYLAGFLDLSEGSNEIRLVAEDVGGNTGNDRVTITYSLPDDPLPPEEVPPDLDFVAIGIEPTQVIQGWGWIGETPVDIGNSTPLIAGKKTLVRFYAEARGTTVQIPQVNAMLRGYRDGVELPDSPLYATSNRVTLVPDETHLEQRLDSTKTFNFILPPAWTEPGVVRLEATVNHFNGIRERPGAFDVYNSVIRDVGFNDTEQMCVFMYPVTSTEEGNVAPTWSECFDNLALLRQLYPVNPAKLGLYAGGTVTTSLVVGSGDEDALSDLAHRFRRALGLYYGLAYSAPCANVVYLALTDDTVEHRGITTSDRPVSVSVASTAFSHRLRTAHEVGHSQGMGHVQGCDNPAEPYEDYPAYTDPLGESYPSASIGDWGVDIRDDNTFTLKDPATQGDIMSYCNAGWTSVYTWNWLASHYGVGAGAVAAVAPKAIAQAVKPVPYLVINGAVAPGGVVTLDPAWTDQRPEGSSDYRGTGKYQLLLFNKVGDVLFERRFNPSQVTDLEEYAVFQEVVPYKEGTHRIQLSGPGIDTVFIEAGPSAPDLRITSPKGGEHWPATGKATVSWDARDTDEDSLTYAVFYSRDDGDTWQVIKGGLNKPALSVTLDDLPGCENTCRIRVAASDGINQSQDESESFSKAGRPPIVRILSPKPVAVYTSGSMAWFEAAATDREDGTIPDAQVYWLSGRDGLLGNGRTFATRRLSPGLHRIGVVAIDSDGQWAGHMSSVFVVKSAAECMGDCSGDGTVTVNEVIRGVNIALGNLALAECRACDGDGNGKVMVNELVHAVNHALEGCS